MEDLLCPKPEHLEAMFEKKNTKNKEKSKSQTRRGTIEQTLEAGGKPSNWFSPGTLVELISLKKCRHCIFTYHRTVIFEQNRFFNFRKAWFSHLNLSIPEIDII